MLFWVKGHAAQQSSTVVQSSGTVQTVQYSRNLLAVVEGLASAVQLN